MGSEFVRKLNRHWLGLSQDGQVASLGTVCMEGKV